MCCAQHADTIRVLILGAQCFINMLCFHQNTKASNSCLHPALDRDSCMSARQPPKEKNTFLTSMSPSREKQRTRQNRPACAQERGAGKNTLNEVYEPIHVAYCSPRTGN